MASQKEQLEELLASYIDGTLSDSDRRAVESYLDGQPDLRRDIQGAIQDSRAMQALPHIKAPAGLNDAMQQQVERDALLGDPHVSRGAARSYALPKFALAAMLIAGAGVGYFVFDKFYLQPGAMPIAIDTPKDAIPTSRNATEASESRSSTLDDLADSSEREQPAPAMESTGLGEGRFRAPAGRTRAFKNVQPAGDPDLMQIAQDEISKDGKLLMKLSVNTQVVEAAEMSLTGFATDNRLQITDAELQPTGERQGAATDRATGNEDQKTRDEQIAAMLEEGGAWSQLGPFDIHQPTNQVRRVLVRDIRVDQIDTLRRLVDRAPGSSQTSVVAIDSSTITDLSGRAGLPVDGQDPKSEMDRETYRAQPGDRLKVMIDDPDLQKKSEQILAVEADGTLQEQNLNVSGQDLVSIEEAIATQLQFERSVQSTLPRVQVEPLAPIAESVELDPEQVVDLLVVIEGPVPLPPTTLPVFEIDESQTENPTTQDTQP